MLKKSIAIIFSGFFLLGILGCEKEQGPAEKAGKSLDQAVESMGEKYEEAKDAVLDKGPAEKTGESIDDSADRVVDKYEEAKAAVEAKLNE